LFVFLGVLLLAATTAIAAASSVDGLAIPNACTELIQNGGFESVSANWTQEGGNGVQLITNFNPRTDHYSADLAGINSVSHSVRQQFVVPASSMVTLSFWWEQWTQENAPTTADYLAVDLLDSSGALLGELERLGADPSLPPWEQVAVSLASRPTQGGPCSYASEP
jgi:hypothetical protein